MSSPAEAFRLLPPADHGRWDEFVAACPDGTIFHTAWWHRAWDMEPVVHALPDGREDIQAGICYCVERRRGTTSIVRPPYTSRNGPVFPRSTERSRHKQRTQDKKMLLQAIQSLPRLGVYDFLLRPCDEDLTPFLWNGFDTLIGYTYVLPVAERETWMQHASKTQRWSIGRAQREAAEKGFVVEESPPIDDVVTLLGETAEYKDYSMNAYRRAHSEMVDSVRQRHSGAAYLLRDASGKPASTAVMVYDGHRAYYVAGGIRRDLRQGSLLNVLLIHRMIEAAHGLGLDFDFEGSVLPGVERFFRSFGGHLQPIYRVLKFRSLPAYLIWHAYRYATRHRQRAWVFYE